MKLPETSSVYNDHVFVATRIPHHRVPAEQEFQYNPLVSSQCPLCPDDQQLHQLLSGSIHLLGGL